MMGSTMPKRILSADMQAQVPHFHVKTKVLRKHDETMVHPVFRWIKRKITVVDQLQFVGIVVTQNGRSYEIPLQGLPDEEEVSTA